MNSNWFSGLRISAHWPDKGLSAWVVGGAAWLVLGAMTAPAQASTAKAQPEKSSPAAKAAGPSAPAAQTLVGAQSDIRFVTRQMGVPVEGRFKQFSVQSGFDPRAPQNARIAMQIEMASAGFGIAETDAELVKPDWFHTAKFAQARFESSAVRAKGPGQFEVSGQLTIKGVSKPVTVPVMLTQSSTAQGLLTLAKGEFQIRRTDFRIGDGEWGDTSIVANEVVVKFSLALLGVPPL
jgi:polyisoprenoid-binding protein YceI